MNSTKFVADKWTSILPNNWEDRSMITLVSTADAASGFATNIVVTKQKTALSVEEYAAEQAALMRRELETGGGRLQILDERATEIGGKPAYQRLQRFDAGSGQIIQQAQTFFRGRSEIYVVTGTATVEAFDRAIGAFKQFVENFRIN